VETPGLNSVGRGGLARSSDSDELSGEKEFRDVQIREEREGKAQGVHFVGEEKLKKTQIQYKLGGAPEG